MTGFQLNELGLPVNTAQGALTNPVVIVYAPPKTGKSTDVAVAFQNAYFITTDHGVLHPYSVLRANHPERNLRDHRPHQITIPLEMLQQGQCEQFLRELLGRIAQLVRAQRFPYRAVVFDEFNTMLQWMWPEVERRYPPKVRGNDPWGQMERLAYGFLQEPKSWGLAVGAVMHDQPPSYNDDGSIKYRGGPKVPIGRMREGLVAIADVALRISLEKPKPKLVVPNNGKPPETDNDGKPKAPTPAQLVTPGTPKVLRRYHTEPSELWLGGVRGGFELEPTIELGLANVLPQIGMSVT